MKLTTYRNDESDNNCEFVCVFPYKLKIIMIGMDDYGSGYGSHGTVLDPDGQSSDEHEVIDLSQSPIHPMDVHEDEVIDLTQMDKESSASSASGGGIGTGGGASGSGGGSGNASSGSGSGSGGSASSGSASSGRGGTCKARLFT